MIAILCAGCWAIVIAAFGVRFGLPRLSEVYDVRLASRETVNATALSAYALAWLTKVIHPIIAAYGIIARNRNWFILASAGQVVCYGFTAQKSVLLSAFLMLSVAVLTNSKARNRFGARFPMAATGLVLMAVVVDSMLGSRLGVSLFVRRLILTAGVNTENYFIYFSENSTYGLLHSAFRMFGSPPSDLPPARLIGEAFYGSKDVSANANLFADGFANFGSLGILGFGLLAGCVFGVIDLVTHHSDLRFASIALALPAIALSNTALLTTLLTHGLLVIVFFVASKPSSFGDIVGSSEKADLARGQRALGGAVPSTSHRRPPS